MTITQAKIKEYNADLIRVRNTRRDRFLDTYPDYKSFYHFLIKKGDSNICFRILTEFIDRDLKNFHSPNFEDWIFEVIAKEAENLFCLPYF